MNDNKRTITPLTTYTWMNLYVSSDEYEKAFYYAERRGVDSIAFLCYKSEGSHQMVLVNLEYKPPIGTFLRGAFGGSLDKTPDPLKTVISEVKEEAGYAVDPEDVISLGKVFVSSMMNQFCHLYLVNVNEAQNVGRHPQNEAEKVAETTWVRPSEVFMYSDWKAITIVSKAVRLGWMEIS
jgi:hypothetical protein